MENNEILFKNTSKMDEEEITKFQNVVMKKRIVWFSIVFSLIFAGIGAGLSFVDLTFGIIIIVCGLLGGFVLFPYLMKEMQKKQNKSILSDKKYLNTYEFYQEFIAISTQSSENNSNSYQQIAQQKLYYKDIYQVWVYNDRLFIFINPSQSFIFNFKGMTKGTAGEVVELFKTKGVKLKNN